MSNTIEIVIKQTGKGDAIAQAQKGLGGLSGVAKSATGILGGVGGALGGVATVAGGIIAANLFGKVVEGIGAFASTGLDAVGSAQQLETSLKALLTANNMYAQTTETVTEAVTKQLMTEDELGFKYDELNAKLVTQQATYQEQQEKIRQLTEAYGENGLAVIKARAQHDQLALKIADTEREISGLTASETEYVTTTKESYSVIRTQAEALALAKDQTAELMDFVSKLAVISPFETETVEQTTKYAIAAGLGVEQTKEFVPAFLDLAGAVGISSNELGFAADQLFQVRKVGKLTQIDLRQLRRLGIDLGKIIGVEMGMSVEEFNKQAEKSPEIFDELFGAVTRFSQNTFAGTAQEMATSVKGLQSTFSDIFVIGSREFMRPLVDAVTPTVSAIAGGLSDFIFGGEVAALGQSLADLLTAGLTGEGLFAAFQDIGLPPGLALQFSDIAGAIRGIIEGTRGFEGLLIALGLSSETIGVIQQAQNYIQGIIDAVTGGNFYDILAAIGFSGTNITAIYEIKGAFDSVWTAITSNLIPSSTQMGSIWNDTLLPAIMAVGNWINANLLPFLADLAGMYSEFISALLPELVSLWNELTVEFQQSQPALAELWAAFGELAAAFGFNIEEGSILDTVLAAIKISLQLMTASVQALHPAISILSDVISYVAGVTQGWLEDITALVTAFTSLGDTSTSLIERLASLGTAFGNFIIPDELIPGSPTPFEMGLRGIGDVVSGILPESFTAFFALVTEQLTALIVGPLTLFIQALDSIYLVSLPMLTNIWTVSTSIIINQLTMTIATINTLIAVINQIAGAIQAAAQAIIDAMKKAEESFKKAAERIKEDLIPAVNAAAKAFEKMAAAAKKAAEASKDSGSASASAGGVEFQRGTGARGFTVPGGFPNDSFPMRVSSGEQVFVAPRGQTLAGMLGAGNTTNYYFNQTVYTNADSSSVIGDFQVMRGLLGA